MPSAVATAPVHAKSAAPALHREPVTPSWVGRVSQLKPANYADGMPIHSPEYICCKLILRPNKFHSRESFFAFGRVFKEPAKQHDVKFSVDGFDVQPVKLREVPFIDNEDFRLYNSDLIPRRCIAYKERFPIGEPEIVFSFRHTDLRLCAETDVRPHILGDHRVKFKVQRMPLKERLSGVRMLFSHNVQFNRSAIGMGKENVANMDQLIDLLPALAKVRKMPGEKIHLVSKTIIEGVPQDIGILDFGDGLTCKANVAIWRTRGEHRPLIGEFAYQLRFQDRDKLSKDALRRAEEFFISLQYSAEEYIALNCTKTATMYSPTG